MTPRGRAHSSQLESHSSQLESHSSRTRVNSSRTRVNSSQLESHSSRTRVALESPRVNSSRTRVALESHSSHRVDSRGKMRARDFFHLESCAGHGSKCTPSGAGEVFWRGEGDPRDRRRGAGVSRPARRLVVIPHTLFPKRRAAAHRCASHRSQAA